MDNLYDDNWGSPNGRHGGGYDSGSGGSFDSGSNGTSDDYTYNPPADETPHNVSPNGWDYTYNPPTKQNYYDLMKVGMPYIEDLILQGPQTANIGGVDYSLAATPYTDSYGVPYVKYTSTGPDGTELELGNFAQSHLHDDQYWDYLGKKIFNNGAGIYADFWDQNLGWGYGTPASGDGGGGDTGDGTGTGGTGGGTGGTGGTGFTPPPPVGDVPPGPTYTPPWPVDNTMSAEDITQYGLNAGKDLLNQSLQNPLTMPEWWGNDYTYMDSAEYASQFPDLVQPANLAQQAIPGEYSGLMGSDYDRLEQSLRTPGEIAATNAYDRGSRDLNAYMGNSGMYGSSVMAQQANEGLNREYMNAEAANAAQAAAQRYGLQQNDLQFGAQYGLQRADLGRQQNLDQWKARTTNNGLLSDYQNQRFQFDVGNAEASRNERNMLNQQRYQHQLQQVNWNNMMNEQLMNQALALSGQGAPLANASMNYRSQQDALDAADNQAWWNLGTQVVGGLFGFGQDGGYQNSLVHSLFSN